MIVQRRSGAAARRLAMRAALLAAALVIVGPFLWIAVASFRTQISLMMGEVLFTPTLMNFDELLFSKSSDYAANYLNSLLVASLVTLIVLAISTLAAYSLARLAWPRWVVHLLLLWALAFQMVPAITLVGAWFSMLRAVGLDSSYTGLVLAHVALNLPMGLWMMTIYVRDIPMELEEAARLDGATTPAILWRIVVPLSRAGLAATAILVFIFSWNEFAVALNLTSRRTATIPVAVANFAQEYVIKHTAMAAAATLALIPALVLLLAGQRYIVKGLMAGASK
ncbi:carbohydrate ABC transporter permease [Vineibacter terrae]|uniref:carbohydrate ABC transporter permease n=1 Tax=Vineibacter terrae TaxID=2586908 RepID=UPI002E3424BF|nr:carbohydrate ABC transporter permease [Vineibacter terrae]HEX2885192.1 carbohydrate ABC transporter permease [Vineibacter terrae]